MRQLLFHPSLSAFHLIAKFSCQRLNISLVIDYVNLVLGEFTSFSSHLAIQRPEVAIIRDDKLVETVKMDVPDLIIMHGTVNSGVP